MALNKIIQDETISKLTDYPSTTAEKDKSTLYQLQQIKNSINNLPSKVVNLGDLNDVDTSGASNGKVLKYDGTKWIPGEGGGSGGSVTWGNITGTLSNQTDLNTVLNNKSELANTVKSLSISGKTITVTPGSGSDYTLTTQDTVYTHPNSGVTTGTYKSVTVNEQGHVTSGTNPTTLSGYGITDGVKNTETLTWTVTYETGDPEEYTIYGKSN